MNKKDMKQDLMRACGGQMFITKKQFQKLMGYSSINSVNKYLEGLEAVDGKLYYIPDVVDELLSRRTKHAKS